MVTEISSKYIEKEGYWFNVRKVSKDSFVVYKTQRKRNQIDRDGIGYTVQTFNNQKNAEKYLEDLSRPD